MMSNSNSNDDFALGEIFGLRVYSNAPARPRPAPSHVTRTQVSIADALSDQHEAAKMTRAMSLESQD